MKKHSRKSAGVAMAATLGIGLAVLAGMEQFRARPLGAMSVEELEGKIAGSRDAALWCAYGDKLRAGGKYKAAAQAYEKAVEYAPELVEAKLNQGVALALGQDAAGFFAYVGKLSINHPKVAVDLLERAEVKGMRADGRWGPAEASAKAQAVD